ncbi:uncharacterized protein [Physcomitrium patens]|uniref:uncharacterized protein isoform X2 n=1 Tax=Physcomitrium patens TaxID=3218 RepID=UPI003CCCBCAB
MVQGFGGGRRSLWHCAVFRGGGKFLCGIFTSEERDSPIRGLALSEVAEFWFVVRFTVVAASGWLNCNLTASSVSSTTKVLESDLCIRCVIGIFSNAWCMCI